MYVQQTFVYKYIYNLQNRSGWSGCVHSSFLTTYPYILHLPLHSPKSSALSDWNELSKDDVFRNGAHLIGLGREDMKFSTARYWPIFGKTWKKLGLNWPLGTARLPTINFQCSRPLVSWRILVGGTYLDVHQGPKKKSPTKTHLSVLISKVNQKDMFPNCKHTRTFTVQPFKRNTKVIYISKQVILK